MMGRHVRFQENTASIFRASIMIGSCRQAALRVFPLAAVHLDEHEGTAPSGLNRKIIKSVGGNSRVKNQGLRREGLAYLRQICIDVSRNRGVQSNCNALA